MRALAPARPPDPAPRAQAPGRGPAPSDEGARAVLALIAAHAGQMRRAELLERVRRSRWAAPAARATGVLAVLLVLAAIGLAVDPRRASAGPAVSAASALGSVALPPAEPPPASSAPAPAPAADAPQPPSATLPDGRLVLNLATEDELTKLPHVGPSRARAILALRTRMGGKLRAVTDLLKVKGIGRKTLAKIAPKVVVDAPPAPPAPPA